MKPVFYKNKLTQEVWVSSGKIEIIEGVEYLRVSKKENDRTVLMRREILERVPSQRTL